MKKEEYFLQFIRFEGKRGDITPLLADKDAFKKAIDEMAKPFLDKKIDKIVGLDSRGFILGGAMANMMKIGFIPIRKSGKLPSKVFSATGKDYKGKVVLEIHQNAIKKGERVLIVDDWLETGGQSKLAIKLIEKLGGKVIGITVLVDDSSKAIKVYLRKYNYHFLMVSR